MTVTLLAITDGRHDYLGRTLDSFEEMVPQGFIGRRVLVNDCLDPVQWARLDDALPGWEILHPDTKRGFAGAIQAGWDHIGPGPGEVFHLEDDFVFEHPVPLADMIALLGQQSHLQQVALQRQPWNPRERAAGGLMRADRQDFTEHECDGIRWTTHRRFFTTNPSLYRRDLIGRGWPQEDESEGKFSLRLFADAPDAECAFLGHIDDVPAVWHIGDERAGFGY